MPQAAGTYDLYVIFADKYHWPYFVTAALDPDILDEHLVFLRAQADADALERRRARRRQGRGR